MTDAILAGIATGKVMIPPNPDKKPLVTDLVFCQRMREFT